MRAPWGDGGHTPLVPHSCGHRACPHGQHHESQQWLERQLAKQVPATYFLLTFTVAEALRARVWANQQALYDHLIRASWETVRTFVRNDTQLQGEAGAMAVLHTHSRRLDFHPHVHLVVPAAAIDPDKKRWRTKRVKRGYLFNHKALAKVFRAKLLAAIAAEGLVLPAGVSGTWVVDCKNVGRGEKALVYLGRYLYRGVIQEKDIVACENGQVIFRYRHAKRKRFEYRTLPGALPRPGAPACLAQRLSPGPPLRLSASQQQTRHRCPAVALRSRSEAPDRAPETAASTGMLMRRGRQGHRADRSAATTAPSTRHPEPRGERDTGDVTAATSAVPRMSVAMGRGPRSA
jgi:hypothetical protein